MPVSSSDDVLNHLALAKSGIVSLETETYEKNERLEQVRKQLGDAESDLTTIKKKIATETTKAAEITVGLNDEISELKLMQASLTEDLGNLGDKRASLLIENARLEKENKTYREYEDKANKALDAREKSLNARDDELTQRENLKPRPKSVLSEL